MPLEEMLQRMSSRELTEWQAFEQLEGPLGGRRGDIQAALITLAIASAHHSGKGKAPELEDFILQWGSKDEEQSPSSMKTMLEAMNKQFRGEDKR